LYKLTSQVVEADRKSISAMS